VITRVLSLALSALLSLTAVGFAQKPESAATARPLAGRAGRAGRDALPPRQQAKRQELARQVRKAFAQVVQRRLNLNDEQARHLQTVDQRFQAQRGQLLREERQARLSLKAEMQGAGTPDQAKVAQYMDQLVQAQHKRADLLESEQKELAGFLTPLQRAKYQALRDQLNKRVQQMQPAPPNPPETPEAGFAPYTR
jgi:Spy/CpxP family protein refolding chaperone